MLYIDNQASFFSVNNIIKPFSTKTIYGINFNNTTHFICKSTGVNDGEQLDNRSELDAATLNEISGVITEVEKKFKKKIPLEIINMEIFRIIAGRKRSLLLKWV